jgi:hypothetical protein
MTITREITKIGIAYVHKLVDCGGSVGGSVFVLSKSVYAIT